ncbi:MAG TPA: ferritin-like domain-containing protein [Baekduia sp.]|nr:ferritin-like domain-containing protein [Baekduia sp.]
MTNPLNLDTVDVDGAVQELAADAGFGRADFLKKGALAGGGILVGSLAAGEVLGTAHAAISTRRRSPANDVKILNFALTLEFLEAEFYKQARDNQAYLNPLYRRFGEVVADHEAKHVAFLRRVLGSKAVKKPKFDFKDTVTDPNRFAQTAQVLEDTGVMAYLGQVNNIKQPVVLGSAGTIATVEARHAAWIRFLNKEPNASTALTDLPAPLTFDQRKSERTILKAVQGTGFISG